MSDLYLACHRHNPHLNHIPLRNQCGTNRCVRETSFQKGRLNQFNGVIYIYIYNLAEEPFFSSTRDHNMSIKQ